MEAEVYELDALETDAATVTRLHRLGRKVIGYINAGAWEDWRFDRADFPAAVIGKDYAGWPGEKWLDIRQVNAIGPIIQKRLDLCQRKGFDAVEFDNVDGYLNQTGFALTARDQLAYNRWLAQEAHRRHLAAGLKNDAEQAQELCSVYDFAIVESCLAQGWCGQMQPFLAAGKAVFAIEYTDTNVSVKKMCLQAQALSLNAILKHRALDAYRKACP